MPVDPDANWNLGISLFKTVNVSKEYLYLASSFPRLIREKITGVSLHRFSGEELASLQKAIINTELKKEVANLLAGQKKRDEELFNESKPYQKQKINDEYQKSSALIRERISFLRQLDHRDITVKPEKPLGLKDNNGLLYPPPTFSALGYAESIGAHALLWGMVEEIRGYLYCELYVFDRIQEKNVFFFREAGTPHELFASLEKSIPELLTALWGRPWATLLVDVTPEFSFIKVNGKLLGMGTVETQSLEPGEITLEIDAPGFSPIRERLTLAARERLVREYKLVANNEDQVLIETVPPAADAYLNSLWIGKTPLILPLPAISSRLIIRREGFTDLFHRLEPGSPPTLFFPLLKATIDFDRFRESTRSRFYTSLAAFLLSLPLPIFSYSLSWDNIAGNRPGETEFFSASYYWTAFISGVLFVNLVFDLLRYLQSRDKPIG
jgi:hypothetical protein